MWWSASTSSERPGGVFHVFRKGILLKGLSGLWRASRADVDLWNTPDAVEHRTCDLDPRIESLLEDVPLVFSPGSAAGRGGRLGAITTGRRATAGRAVAVTTRACETDYHCKQQDDRESALESGLALVRRGITPSYSLEELTGSLIANRGHCTSGIVVASPGFLSVQD